MQKFRIGGRKIYYQDDLIRALCLVWCDTVVEKDPHDALVPHSDLSIRYVCLLGIVEDWLYPTLVEQENLLMVFLFQRKWMIIIMR